MNANHHRKVKIVDRIARWTISFGGLAIIGSMLLMVLFMVRVTLPLFQAPKDEITAEYEGVGQPLMVGVGPYLERGFTIFADGRIGIFDARTGDAVDEQRIEHPAQIEAPLARVVRHTKSDYGLYWRDGSVGVLRARFNPEFDPNDVRTIQVRFDLAAGMPPLNAVVPEFPRFDPLGPSLFTLDEQGSQTVVRLGLDQHIYVARITETEDMFGDVARETKTGVIESPLAPDLSAWVVSRSGDTLYGGTRYGEIVAWDLSDLDQPVVYGPVRLPESEESITAMNLLFGDVSLIVGGASGSLTAWNLDRETLGLRHIKTLPAMDTGVYALTPSFKDKSFIAQAKIQDIPTASVSLYHLTTERRLLDIDGESAIIRFGLSERGDGLLLQDADGRMELHHIHAPHADVSAGVLWTRTWYESYDAPQLVWQSSSASDDFEPKISLAPLLFGTLKGAFYSMLFSFPLAFFAALYVSHMMRPRWRSVVKPVVELMAAAPTVVIGFLAALWLAPKLEGNLLGVLMAIGFIPMVAGAGLFLLFRTSKITGVEFLWAAPLAVLGAYIAFQVGSAAQSAFFDGNINLWLFKQFGWQVDQRNCVVIAFALGFAVIPIIFTISEDALYNVPKHMTAAALALGSSRWQTVRHVVLPMAAPGIFAATMIGFGRAVGETMIVLMATGNTPILSPSILNGMRTLSANIAVEIPEAPVDSSLYRVLFLSALLLFAITFLVNTLAEVVRVRLKARYKNV